MQIKTQYLGHEMQERFRELVLEEHEECGCRCLNVRPEHCMEPSLFNNETCSCKCDTSLYNRDQIRCETFNDRTWDPVTCTCRRIEEGRLLDGPKQDDDARKAAEAAGILPAEGQSGEDHFHGHRHNHKKSSRPGHDVDPAIVTCVGEECNHPSNFIDTSRGKTGIAAMPKAQGSTNNGWLAIAVCTFLVAVFATTTVYYWQKAKKMAKDLFAEKESTNTKDDLEDDDDDDIEVPSPPPKPSGKKPGMFDDSTETALVSSPVSLQKELLLNNSIKSPVEIVKKLCDTKKMNHVSLHPKASSSHVMLNGLVASASSPKIVTKSTSKSKIIDHLENSKMMEDSTDSEGDMVNDEDSNSPEAIEVETEAVPASGPHKNIMELLLAAAAKRDNSNKHHQSNGIAKAASMSELEASQLEPDRGQLHPQHRHHHHHHHHHLPPGGPSHGPNGPVGRNHHSSRRDVSSSGNAYHRASNFSVNREVVTTHVSHHRRRSTYNNDELEAIEAAALSPDSVDYELAPNPAANPPHAPTTACNECVHSSSLLRSQSKRPRHSNQGQPQQPPTHLSQSSRHMLQHQHSFHHPHNLSERLPSHQPPQPHYQPQHHTLDRRHHGRRSQNRPRSRLYHGSFGQLLDDEDLLQQCLATLMMDAAILRQQQQIQQEQLQLQQEQLQQQQSVIEKQKYQKAQAAAASEAAMAAALEAANNNAGTDTQSVIESIAGDGATVVTVDRLEVSVEVVDDGDQSPAEDRGC